MANFIGMVFGILKAKGIDTSNMTTEEAIKKFNEINNKSTETNNPVKSYVPDAPAFVRKMHENRMQNNIETQKIKKLTQETKEYIKNNPTFRGYKLETIDIEKAINDGRILDDDSTLNTRRVAWGNSYDKYEFDEEKYDKDNQHPIMIVERNGKYFIEDGRHRLVALKNKGFKNVEVLVKREKE